MPDSIGTKILSLRGQTETQQELADALGVSRSLVKAWENNERSVRVDDLIKLAKHFDVSADYLLGLTDVQKPEMDFRAVCAYTGLSAEAIESIIKNFKNFQGYELSGALCNESFIELFPAFDDIRKLSELVSFLFESFESLTADNAKALVDKVIEQNNKCLGSRFDFGFLFDCCEGREAASIQAEFMLVFRELRTQLFELSEKWSDFLESFIPTKDIVSAGKEIMREITEIMG